MNNSYTLLSATFFGLLGLQSIQLGQKSFVTQKVASAPISKISYSTTGGRGGNTISLEITATTLIYTKGHAGEEKTIRERTSRNLWSSLTRSINIKDFDRIKSNPGHAMYDGIDVTITVQVGRRSYTIVNGSEDEVNYKRIRSFVNILESQLSRLDKKMNW